MRREQDIARWERKLDRANYIETPTEDQEEKKLDPKISKPIEKRDLSALFKRTDEQRKEMRKEKKAFKAKQRKDMRQAQRQRTQTQRDKAARHSQTFSQPRQAQLPSLLPQRLPVLPSEQGGTGETALASVSQPLPSVQDALPSAVERLLTPVQAPAAAPEDSKPQQPGSGGRDNQNIDQQLVAEMCNKLKEMIEAEEV